MTPLHPAPQPVLIYEVVFRTDEAYFTVAHFELRQDAEAAAAIGNVGRTERDSRFEVADRFMFRANDQPFETLEDLKETLEEVMGDVDDWFDE